MAQRLPLQYRYDRHELKGFIALAGQLNHAAGGTAVLMEALAALDQAAAKGQAVLNQAGAEPGELEAANLQLREAVGRLIQSASNIEDDTAHSAIDKVVMAHAKDQLLRERAWLALQGWEGKDAKLPDVESLISD